MPDNEKPKPDYVSTVYTNLKQAYGDKFTKSEDEFRDKVSNDYEYRKTVHTNLKQAYGDNFKKDFNTFNFGLPSIKGPTDQQAAPETTIEDFDRAKEEIPKIASQNARLDYSRSKVNSAMPSETTQGSGGVYRAIKSKGDEVTGWAQKQKEETSQESFSKYDPEVLKSDIQTNSQLAGRLFSKKEFGPDAVAYGKYLMHLKNSNPDKYEEKSEKLAKYGLDLDDNERYQEIQEGLNGYAKMLDNDKAILKARGGEMRLKEVKKLNGKSQQLERELNSYGNPESIPDDKKLALKAKYDEIQRQKEAFEGNPENKEFVDKYDQLFNGYDEIIKGQNKLIMDSPEILKKKNEQENIRRQEEIISGDFKNVTKEDLESGTVGKAVTYQGTEALGNVWNTVTDNAVGLLELWKDIGDGHQSGYSLADRLVDKTKSFVDSNIKATISETDLFDEKGNMRWYRFGPNLAKVGTDMAIMLAPVGRLKDVGTALKMGKYADEAALVSSQFATTYDDYKKDALAHGMSSKDAEGYGLAAGLVTSLTAAISPNEAILNPGSIKGSLGQLAERYAKQGITGLTKREGFNKLVGEMTDILKTTVKESAKEATQENAESVAEKIINTGYNANKKSDPMSKKLDEEITREEFLANTIFSVALAGPATLVSQSSHSQQITDGATFELLKNYDESQKILNEMHDDGRLSEEAYTRVSGQLEKTKEIYDRVPPEWSDASKQNLIPFLREKVGLEERVSKLDKNFSLRDNKRLNEINKTLDAFNEKESGIEASAAVEGGEKTANAKIEDQAPEDQTQYEPLTDDEIEVLKTGSPVSIMEDGKKVDGKIEQIFPNGEVMLEIGARKKIVLDSNLIKEKPKPEVEGELELSDDELKTLKEETEPETKQQKESSSEPGTEAWNLAVKNRLEKVFKGSELSFDQKEFDAAAESSEHNNASDSTGFYDPKTNKLFLNPKKVKKDTPIHEFGHIWTDVLKEKNPQAYNQALQLAKESDFYKAAESNPNYAHLSSDALAEEAFVTALGKKGVDVFSDIADKNSFNQFMTDLWDHIKDALGMNEFKIDGDMSFSELVNKAAKDLSKNKTVELKTKEGEIKKQTDSKKDHNTDLTPEEKTVQDEMEKDLTENYEERKKEYLDKNGLIFNTDEARILSPEYKKHPSLLSNATQIPARDFVNKIYQEELKKPAPEGKKNLVVFTAGGSGVGKSFAVNKLKLNNQLTVDTNLSNFDRGIKDIDEALEHGKDVEIFFTYRDPVNSFLSEKGGIITRAKRIGRTVPYDIVTSIHEKSLKTIIQLSEHYKDNEKVNFQYFFNSFDKGEAKPISLDDVKNIKTDFKKAKEEIKNELERRNKTGEFSEELYAGLTGDTGKLQDILGKKGMEQERGGGVSKGTKQPGEKFGFDPESGVGKKVKDFVKKNLEAGIKESVIKTYLKDKTKLSDDTIKDIIEAAKKKEEVKPEIKTPVQKTEPTKEVKKEKKAPEKPKEPEVKKEVKVNEKIIDLSRIPVNSRVNTVLSRVFENPETPETLKAELSRKFGSKEQMLRSKRYSQKEARQLGAEITKAFDNLNDAIDFAINKGYNIDGDIQLAILDNVVSDAYNSEQKAKTQEERDRFKEIQAKALTEIAAVGEQSGRRVSYYQMMYNVNPVIFGEKMAEAISDIQAKILDKKLGDNAQNADEKIDQLAKESEEVVNREKKKAAESSQVNEAITRYSGPKYKGPKTTKTSKEIDAIRKSRSAKMEEIKKKLGQTKKGPDEKFAFEESESQKLDESRLTPIKEIGDTFIDEGYLTYTQWSRKVQNEFKDAGIEIYGKELKEVWGRSKEKVDASIKENYKNLSPEEVESLIQAQATEKIKEQNQAIKDILADTNVSPEMKSKVKNRLMTELGLSEGYSQNITDSFMSEFETQAKKQVESKLRQIRNRSLISSFNSPNKESEQRIVTDILNGTFDGEKLKPAFYEAYGMTPAKVDQKLKDRLIDLSRKVSIQKEGSLMKDKALRDLYNEISKYKPTSLFNLGTDVYYSSLLSGYETHIKNFALFNALQVYVNKPMQIAMQNILSGNKSKAATAIYSKELFKTMFNEAKGIVLTGTNSFYEKPNEQSELEKFTKKPGANPLKFLWRYAPLPTRMLQAEDAFGTIGLSEARSRQLMYAKLKKDLENKGEEVIPEQLNEQVNKLLGYTKETAQAAKISAEQSLKNYYGDDFNLQQELNKPVKSKEDKLRKERIKTEYVREIHRSMVSQRDADITEQAINWAKTALLQNDPEGTLGRVYIGVQALINQIPALRLFVPFLKVPLNVTNNLIQSTPGTSYIRLITGKKGVFGGQKMSRQEYIEHRQKAITYTLMTAALAALQEGLRDEEDKPFFYVTGKNGKSYTESSAREVAGIDQPYTVYIGGKPVLKYQYTPWMPLFTSLGIYNDIRLENNGEIPEGKEASDLVANAFIKYANTINEQAALKGMNEIFNVIQEGYDAFLKGEGDWSQKVVEFAEKKAAQTAKSLLVPNAATQANTDIKGLFDIDRIATTNFADDIIKDMPIVDIISQQFFGNESKIDVLGRPIKEKFGIAGYQKMGDDEYYRLFVDKHYLPYSYSKKRLKTQIEDETGEMKTVERPLSLDDRYRANKLRGDMLLNYMNENMEDLKQMDDESFQSVLKSVISSYDQQVEQELFNSDNQ